MSILQVSRRLFSECRTTARSCETFVTELFFQTLHIFLTNFFLQLQKVLEQICH